MNLDGGTEAQLLIKTKDLNFILPPPGKNPSATSSISRSSGCPPWWGCFRARIDPHGQLPYSGGRKIWPPGPRTPDPADTAASFLVVDRDPGALGLTAVRAGSGCRPRPSPFWCSIWEPTAGGTGSSPWCRCTWPMAGSWRVPWPGRPGSRRRCRRHWRDLSPGPGAVRQASLTEPGPTPVPG